MEDNARATRRAVTAMLMLALVLGLATAACKEKELNAAAYVEPAPNPGPDLGIPVFATKKDFESQMMLSADKPDSDEYFAALVALKRLAPNTRLLIRHVGNFSYKGQNPEYAEVEVVDGPEAGKRFFVRSSGIKVGAPAGQAAKAPVNVDQCRSACFTRKVREVERAGRNPNTEPGGPGVLQAACHAECAEAPAPETGGGPAATTEPLTPAPTLAPVAGGHASGTGGAASAASAATQGSRPPATAAAVNDAGRRQAAAAAMRSAASLLGSSCKVREPTGKGSVHVTFGSDGKVTRVAVDPPYAGTFKGKCVQSVYSEARAEPFSGEPLTVDGSFSFP